MEISARDIVTKVILHVDMDAFFASIEQRDNPEWKGKPVIVGARPGTRGVVSAASYEARKFGIHSAMPINQAYRSCPFGVFVRPRMDAYGAESTRLMEVFTSFSPLVERISIDEAFIDMSGTEKLWGKPPDAAAEISGRILRERSLTCSIGIAPNKFLAKLASDAHKPAGITETPFNPDEIRAWLAPMPVSRIWGIGKITEKTLNQSGIRTIGQMQFLSKKELIRRFGANGVQFYDLCRGVDDREVTPFEPAKSISREFTFNRDSSDPHAWKKVLLDLADDVGRRARREGVTGGTVFLTFRKSDFSRHTLRKTLASPTNTSRHIYETAVKLLEKASESVGTLRLIGVGLTNFTDAVQTDLFDDGATSRVWERSEAARDAIEKRFGGKAIFRASDAPASKPPPRARPLDS
jgi:DNA polymerase IV